MLEKKVAFRLTSAVGVHFVKTRQALRPRGQRPDKILALDQLVNQGGLLAAGSLCTLEIPIGALGNEALPQTGSGVRTDNHQRNGQSMKA